MEEVKSAKYFGLNVDNKLNFNTHKANATLALVLVTTCNHCSRKIKENTYKTYVRPILEYVSAV